MRLLNSFRPAFAFVVAVFAIELLLSGVHPAAAHEPDASTIEIDTSTEAITVEVGVPVDALASATSVEVADEAVGLSLQREDLVGYLVDHLHITGADGTEWILDVETVRRVTVSGTELVRFDAVADTGVETADSATAAATAAVTAESLTVAYDGVVAIEPSHRSILTVTDTSGAHVVGVFDADTDQLRHIGGNPDGFSALLVEGFHHVLDGADHVLFLVALLIPAPLVAHRRRWTERVAPGPAARRVLHVVTAFTIGHSLTLAASALGWVSAPVTPVETLIGVSVAASAVHALVPLTRRSETLIAAGFGLVHGLAFAGILADLGLRGGVSVAALFAFNIGVELAQLAIVAITFPSLWLLAGTRWYRRVRVSGAAGALMVSLAWVLDRGGVSVDPFSDGEAWVIAHLAWLGAALGAAAVFGRVADDVLDRRPTWGAGAGGSEVHPVGSLRGHALPGR